MTLGSILSLIGGAVHLGMWPVRRTVGQRGRRRWAGAVWDRGSAAAFAVLHIGLRAVAAGCGLGVPLAARILPLDRLGGARHALLLRGAARRRKGILMGWKRLRENAVYSIGPADVTF